MPEASVIVPAWGDTPHLAETRAAQDGADSHFQLAHAEGLRHVVVRAEAEGEYLVGLRLLRRQDEDRQRFVRLAQFLAHVEAALARHHQVEDQQVGTMFRVCGKCRHAVLRHTRGVPRVLQSSGYIKTNPRIVFCNENVSHFE